MATILGDVTGLQQRHQPQNVPTLVEKIKGFLQKAKSFRNAAKYQKLLGGVPSSTPATPPPPPPTCMYRGRGHAMNIHTGHFKTRTNFFHWNINKKKESKKIGKKTETLTESLHMTAEVRIINITKIKKG